MKLLHAAGAPARCCPPFFAVALLMAQTITHAAGLNDTGQTQCYNAASIAVACSAAVGGDAGVNPRQDARYGRDAQAAAGGLSKIGAGAAGFDFTKIANNGTALAAGAALGNAATDWACTKDNVTGLIWEVKTASGLRGVAHTYTWYSTDAASNGGNVGSLGSNTCGGTLSGFGNQCNTQNFALAVNASGGLCAATDWRLPSPRELLTLVTAGQSSPAIDTSYFPNTSGPYYWTRSTHSAALGSAWFVHFDGGSTPVGGKSALAAVRLVRGGQ